MSQFKSMRTRMRIANFCAAFSYKSLESDTSYTTPRFRTNIFYCHTMQNRQPSRTAQHSHKSSQCPLTSPCSKGLMVPASTFRYGSILMLVTLRPQPCSIRPTLEMVTPFPRPETTPPDTTTYFMVGRWGRERRGRPVPGNMSEEHKNEWRYSKRRPKIAVRAGRPWRA